MLATGLFERYWLWQRQGALFVAHRPDARFFSRILLPSVSLFSEGEFLDTGNWRKRATPERVSGGGGWIFVIMKRR